jgi:glycosyltransferase involved in cell wall biosynthesis
MEIIFFSLLFLSIYSYSVYPAVVYILSRLLVNSWHKRDITPQTTIIISVYNEETVIGEKVKNTLSLGYPEESLEIIVISDGSSDRTNEIVSQFKDSRLVLKAFPERAGKTACLNRVVPVAKGDIILFTDANSMFPSDMLAKMVGNFSDDQVGLVTGWTKYSIPGETEKAAGIYSRLEMWTKHWESLTSSCVGADGAIFAIRKTLFKPLKDQDINDFVIPLNVISQSKRVVLDPEVYCFEEPSMDGIREFRRQSRITNRTLRAIWTNLGFLNPCSYGLFSFFLLSHKLLRFSVPFFITGAFLINILLLNVSNIYIAFFLIQIFLFGLGIADISGKMKGKLTNICKFFLITLSAQFIGWIRVFRGFPDTTWTPQR